ncbi:histone H1 [Syzygium oleosum]|uniref:histone H1 n=1 Tax=Syzygium oleosum TaxID=219896 RepID=UPI0024B8D05C|nr:histone H1 [Syzygium oleosum]
MDPPTLAPPYIPPPFAPSAARRRPPPPPAPAAAAPEAPASAAAAAAAAGDAQNHSTHVAANPTPAVAPAHSQPPYAEMIYAAIGALKERDGSSKRAIAKFIEKTYTDLPTTHPALLTHHLKRLKNSGHLVMVKKSYKLPGSGDPAAAPNLPAPTEGSESKRRRGRPPKAKLEGLLAAAPAAPAGAAEPVVAKQGPDGGPAPIPVPLPGHVPAKRGRGRPPKSGLVKSRVGRPLKPSMVAVLANGEQNGPKPRGRPRKNVGGVASVASTGEALSVFGKRRGRPPGSGKGKRPVVASQPRRSTGRPMGRPRKNVALGASLAAGSNDDFRRTLEYIQLKIKEAVGVLRPHLTSSISAVDAIQELEAITTMDFAAVPVVGSSSVAPS